MAGEGNSSGGHLAVQLGEDVYHYQYEDGLIRLFKQAGRDFFEDYRFRQNRSVHAAEITVSDETLEHLTDSFEERLFTQKQQIKQLAAVKEDQGLLEALLLRHTSGKLSGEYAENLPRLSGAGLFYTDNKANKTEPPNGCKIPKASSRIHSALRQTLAESKGDNFLNQKINALEDEIRHLAPGNSATPVNNYSFSEHYGDLLTGFLALRAVHDGLPLTKNVCFQIHDTELNLNEPAIKQAQDYKNELLQSAQTLIASKRPDWGYALFVTLARLIAIDDSIERRAWTFLIGDDETVAEILPEQITLYKQRLANQRREDWLRLQKKARQIGRGNEQNEREFTALEIAANRYRHWLESDKTGRLKLGGDQPLPVQAVPAFPFLITGLAENQLKQALANRHQNEIALLQNESKQNTYNLFSNNCVTALLTLIDQVVDSQSAEKLGGYIDPASNFIPFQAFESVKNSYRIKNTENLLAYRQERLKALYARENENWVYLRESNVMSSSLYNYNPDDAWFVFFTDDSLLLRPIFGAVNLAAAVSQTLFGLFYSPFDQGRTMKTGLRGTAASLPELSFFNIRKGSYPFPLTD